MRDFQVDGLIPAQSVRPTSASELAVALSDFHARGAAIVPWGGGTRMKVGNIPKRYDIALDMTGLCQSVEHVAGDMTLVCDAGASVADLTKLLAENHQRLPFEVPNPGTATIGGSVASNAPSRLRPRFGGIRDWIIGMHIVMADGTMTKSGGRVVKNVQGYDLHRLHTGAFGTLGVIVSVALKLVPLPERTRTVAMWFDRYEAAANAVVEVSHLDLMVESARLYSGVRSIGAIRELATDRYMDADADVEDAQHLMLVKVSGSNAALNRQIDELTGLAGTVPASGYESVSGASENDLWDYLDDDGDIPGLSLRVSAKESDGLRLVDRLNRWLIRNASSASVSSIIDVGYGASMFNVEEIDDDGALRLINEAALMAREMGGSILIEKCPVAVKSEIDVFCIDASSARIMKNMKQQFDPKGVLNPGRFAFGI